MSTELYEKVGEIQLAVNSEHAYKSDASGYGLGDHWDFMSPGDTGDCVGKHEEIYTNAGVKKVGDLKVGDIVLSYDLEKKEYCYKPITKIWDKGLLPGKRVGLKNGQAIDITDNHPLWVRSNQGWSRIAGNYREFEKEDSKYNKRYFKDIDLERWWKRRLPIAVKIPYKIKDIKWMNEDLCFIIGHYLAEGWQEKSKVQSSGYELKDRIIPLLIKNEIPFSEYKNNSEVPCINFLKSEFKEFLRTLKENSFDIHLPEKVFHLPGSKLEKILAGFYLGDGHNGNYSYAYDFESHKQEVYSTSSKQWAEDIQRIGLQLGRSFHVWEQKEHGGLGTKPIYRVTYNPESFFLKDHGYRGISEVGIARSKIEDIGLVEMLDFQVADTRTFIFKNGLISHNCEDFALTKMQELLDYGVDVKNLQLMLCEVVTGQHHAVLAIQTSNRGTLILDNRYGSVMQIGNVPYRFYAYQSAGTDFKSYTARLEAISIEYMNCNALAFADGDSVVVEFSDQDWNQSKVIGFKASPQTCIKDFYQFGGTRNVNWVLSGGVMRPDIGEYTGAQRYKYGTDTWEEEPVLPGLVTIGAYDYQEALQSRIMAISDEGSKTWIVGGCITTAAYNPIGGTRPTYVIKTNDRYDKGLRAWTSRADMPTPERSMGHGFFLSGEIYIYGGSEYYTEVDPNSPVGVYPTYSDFDKYNDNTDVWASLPGALGLSQNHATFKILGKGYLCGGSSNNWETDDGVPGAGKTGCSEYDPVEASWESKTSMPGARLGAAGCHILSRDKGYVVGGDRFTLNSHLEFDAITNSWTAKASLPLPLNFDHGQSVGAGDSESFHCINSGADLNKWNPDTDTFSSKSAGVIVSNGGRYIT